MEFLMCNVPDVQWSMLPPYTTVYGYFQKWRRRGIWQLLHDLVRY